MSTSIEDFQGNVSELMKCTELLHRTLTVFSAAGSWEALWGITTRIHAVKVGTQLSD